MESKAPFDLSNAIHTWRNNLAQSPAFRSENLYELETHLRDSIARLQTQELSAEEAFVIATRRVGKNLSLDAEFGKINGQVVWLGRILWMLIGIQIWELVSNFLWSVSRSAVSLGLIVGHFDLSHEPQIIPTVLFVLMQIVALVGSLTFCWWLIVSKGESLASGIERYLHRRATLVAVCGALLLTSLLISALGYGSQILLLKYNDMRAINMPMRWSTLLFYQLIQVSVLLVLTLVLACKRLRLRKT